MRIQLLSDLHFEFQRDNGRTLAQACHAPDVDVLVLAGDIAVADGIAHALELFSAYSGRTWAPVPARPGRGFR